MWPWPAVVIMRASARRVCLWDGIQTRNYMNQEFGRQIRMLINQHEYPIWKAFLLGRCTDRGSLLICPEKQADYGTITREEAIYHRNKRLNTELDTSAWYYYYCLFSNVAYTSEMTSMWNLYVTEKLVLETLWNITAAKVCVYRFIHSRKVTIIFRAYDGPIGKVLRLIRSVGLKKG
jgi:hypothetical protein